jgi:hypothetical protein
MEENPTVNMTFDISDVFLMYRSTSVHLEKWCGGDPYEQERLFLLKDFLYRIILEHKFRDM